MGWEDPNHDVLGDIQEYAKMAKKQEFKGFNISQTWQDEVTGFKTAYADPYTSTSEAKMLGSQFYLLARGPYAGGKTLFLASGGTADLSINSAAEIEPLSHKHGPQVWSTGYSEVKYHFALSNVKPWSNTNFVLQAFDDPANSTLAERMATQVLQALGQGYDTPDAKAVLMEAIGKVMSFQP